MKSKIIVLALLGIFIYSCSPKIAPPPPSTNNVQSGRVSGSVVAEGKLLYENNCAKCHKLYDTKAFSAEEWQPILKDMQKKAKLQDADREKIYAYITAN